MKLIIKTAVNDLARLLPDVERLGDALERLGQAMLHCWEQRGKVLIAGNGGSAADAMHFAEELCVRYQKNRRALAAIALCDPTVLTCAANDLGYEQVFARQVEALGNTGDILIVLTSSGNSPNLIRAVELANARGLITVGFLGRDGGQLRGACRIELIIPSAVTARIQEAHKLLYHVLCEWIESQVD